MSNNKKIVILAAVIAVIAIGFTAIRVTIGFDGLFRLFDATSPAETVEAVATTEPSASASPSPAPTATAAPTSAKVEASLIAVFYPDTTNSAIAPKVADEYLPDYDNFTEASPITFGAEKYEGRSVKVDDSDTMVEIYLTEVDGGVWAVIITVPLNDPDNELPGLYAQLAEWTIPRTGS
ncbi:MAG: hypothetical protein LBN43_08310 [Oscillospiraceae bacterium]|jgi:hypothetical protein|nr:hypothetical protein [Oscillospiraceae bacterium]